MYPHLCTLIWNFILQQNKSHQNEWEGRDRSLLCLSVVFPVHINTESPSNCTFFKCTGMSLIQMLVAVTWPSQRWTVKYPQDYESKETSLGLHACLFSLLSCYFNYNQNKSSLGTIQGWAVNVIYQKQVLNLELPLWVSILYVSALLTSLCLRYRAPSELSSSTGTTYTRGCVTGNPRWVLLAFLQLCVMLDDSLSSGTKGKSESQNSAYCSAFCWRK